jgi:hypothetical protein
LHGRFDGVPAGQRAPRDHGSRVGQLHLQLPAELEDGVVLALREGGAEPGDSGHTWIELRVRDPHRWIDLRVHRGREPLLEIRIALTNDEWSIRAPLPARLGCVACVGLRREVGRVGRRRYDTLRADAR